MSKFADLKSKAKEMVTGSRDRIEGGLDKAGDMVKERTGGKHDNKVDQGIEKAREGLDRIKGQGDGAAVPPAATQPPGTPTN